MGRFDARPDASERLVYVLVLLIGTVACLLIHASLHATNRHRAATIDIAGIDRSVGLEGCVPESSAPCRYERRYTMP